MDIPQPEQIRTFNFLTVSALQQQICFKSTLIIFHTCIDRDLRRTSIDLGIKSQGQITTLNLA